MPKKTSTAKTTAPKKTAAKKTAASIATADEKAVKKTAAKKAVNKKVAAEEKTESKATAKKAVSSASKAKKVVVKKSATISKLKSSGSSAGFSLEDALSIANKRAKDEESVAKKKADKEKALKAIEEAEKKAEKRVLGAASLFDILGFNPTSSQGSPVESRPVPKKFKKFYDLLIELRNHVKTGLSMHTEETLKRSSKDDAGDLSGYSQHMADAGTDTFDRDFALSMVSNEQDALTEIEAAIERIFSGTYGVCEMTGKQIRDERLMAVPFTRYSVETQKQIEKNQVRSVHRGGIFADASSDDTMTFSDENPDA